MNQRVDIRTTELFGTCDAFALQARYWRQFQHGQQQICLHPLLMYMCMRNKSRLVLRLKRSGEKNSFIRPKTQCVNTKYLPPLPSRAVAAHTHIHRQKTKQKKNTAAGCGCVCVALRVSARPGSNKTKQEGKKCVLRPTGPRRTPTRHGSLSAPFVAAPPHACSRRGAQGRRHERVGGCASGAVGRETHGTPRRKSAARNN
ncbi:hypothetical protein ECC02_003253 [Trypanosoma cruzi]|uniref:Uncharacterized protein n=1 Tax=Trypanosoma cruzi TaxID=5693 RepID=A0A7J6Y9U4_TRYCR|nr:hypothetical protein ECC02_003253 [Trypanosoma cruzi]